MPAPSSAQQSTSGPAGEHSYLFDAFISYRHTHPDRKWAKWLHTMLETYRVPPRLVARGVRPKIGRVFRDEEELSASSNLSTEITAALERSEWLIVVCSPNTPASEWVNQEVQRFREMGRGDKILALLVDGEPKQSFPKALREIRRTVVDAEGRTVEEIEEIEPLAADVRKGVHGGGHGKRMAGLRILAQVLGVRFDELRQREQERKARRTALLAGGAVVLAVAMAAMAVNAHLQRKEAVRQSGIAETQKQMALQSQQEAERRRVESEKREAHGLILQGDLLLAAGKVIEGRQSYIRSIQIDRQLGISSFAAELGLFYATERVVTHIDQWTNETPTSDKALSACAVSPDGLTVLVGGFDFRVRLYDPIAGRVLTTFRGHTGPITSVSFNPDGTKALSTAKDGRTFVWDVAGRSARPLQALVPPEMTEPIAVYSAAFIGGGKWILSAHADNSLRIWDVASGRLLRTAAGKDIASLAVAPDGRTAITGGYTLLTQWDLSGARTPASSPLQIPTSQPATAPVPTASDSDTPNIVEVRSTYAKSLFATSVSVSADGTRAMYGGVLSLTGTLWDVPGWRPGPELTGHTGAIVSAQFSPDRLSILTASHDGTMRMWDTAGQPQRVFAGHEGWVTSAVLSSDGKLAATSSFDGTARLWRVAPDPSRRIYSVENETLITAAISPDGAIVAFGGVKGIYTFDAATRKPLIALGGRGITPLCTGLVFTPDGKSLISTGWDRVVRRWDLPNGKRTDLGIHGDTPASVTDLRGGVAEAGCVAISPDGTTAVSGSDDGRLLLWDLRGNTLLHTFDVPKERVNAILYTPDGKSIVATQFARLLVMDVPSRTRSRTIEGKSLGAVTASLAPDGRTLVTGHLDKAVHLWDLQAGVEVKSLPGHSARLVQVVTSPDGALTYSVADDGTMRLWQMSDGAELRSFEMPLGKPRCVTAAPAPLRAGVTPGGSVALTGTNAGIGCLWDFTHPRARYEMRQQFQAARQTLATNPNDGKALAVVAHWYWLTGVERLAAAAFERARVAGAPEGPGVDAVDPLILARCYWLLDQREAAQKQYARAEELKLASPEYINLCRRAMARETILATPTGPTTRPAGTQPTTDRAE